MTNAEKELIYLLAQKLTGAHPEGTYQIGIFITNVTRRMAETEIRSVSDYLAFAKENADEHAHLLSALSIHTTSWFRENPHYVMLQKVLLARQAVTPFRAWSCACSTGEEVYSLALLFEEFRHFHSNFEYSVIGSDIDPISLNTARRAIYDRRFLTGPISFYKKHVLLGSGETEDLFTFSGEIRKRCKFESIDIRVPSLRSGNFDLILCRNVLIYFQAKQVEEVIAHLLNQLTVGGHLILGHSEMINYHKYGLALRGHSVYEKLAPGARDTVSVDTIAEPTEKNQRTILTPPARILRHSVPGFKPRAILVGASTGGPESIARVLRQMPTDCPPVIIAQHISGDFSRTFGERIAQISGLQLSNFEDGETLKKGHLYCAAAQHHLALQRTESGFTLRQQDHPPINGHRPSVDHLFLSALPLASECVAILLSGMGRDGAVGMRELHRHSAYTFAQSEDDCVVYGMPKEAVLANAVDFIGTADQMHDALLDIIRRQST